jgi:predicted O-methyltransferase YrrM
MNEIDDRFYSVLAGYEQRRQREHMLTGPDRALVDDDGHDQRMRAIGPEAGQLLSLLAQSLKTPRILELGTSFGYSGLWLAHGARASDGRVVSIELDAHKSNYAREQAQAAGLSDWIEHRIGDAVAMIADLKGEFDMVFVDLWKDLYLPCLEAFAPKLAPGAIIVADNMIRPGSDGIRAYAKRIRAMPNMMSVLLPIGTGMEISRNLPED